MKETLNGQKKNELIDDASDFKVSYFFTEDPREAVKHAACDPLKISKVPARFQLLLPLANF